MRNCAGVSYRARTMEVKTRAATIFLAVLLGTGALAGCSGDDRTTSADGSVGADGTTPDEGIDEGAGVTVLRPGAPGEPAEVGALEGAVPAEPPPWNHADLAFVQMMVPHHAQAVEMARLARTRAADPAVRRLAARIGAAQAPEILLMASWLEEQGVQVPGRGQDPMDYDHGAHGHDGMVGMLTPGQLDELRAARGAAFDRLFLRRMVGHHEGALAMADDVAVAGTSLQVAELAADVAGGQGAEITRLLDLLAALD